MLQLLYYTLKRLIDNEKVVSMKSKGFSSKKLTTPTTADNSLSSEIKKHKSSIFFLIFKGNCLKLNATFILRNANLFVVVVVVVVDELDRCSQELFSDFTLKHCLFGGVKLAANADPDKYVYSGYGIGLDSSSEGT